MFSSSSLPYKQLLDIANHWNAHLPDGIALMAPNRPSLTFFDLSQKLSVFGETLLELGLDSSSRIAILAPNGPELAVAFLSCATYATSAPLNPAYQKDELEFYLDDLEASALIIASSLKSSAREVAHSKNIPVLELCSQTDQPAGSFSLEGKTAKSAIPASQRQPDDIGLILHTSGTTARPKQVPLSHRNLCASINHLQQTLALTPQDCCLNLMPLFHIHGLVAALLSSLGSGGSVVCPPGFSATEVFSWMRTFQPTWVTAVPTIHQAILAQAEKGSEVVPTNTLRFIRSSSASLAPTVMKNLEEFFKVPVIEAYGMTEAAHQMASNPLPPHIRKPGSVGLPAGPKIQVLSETNEMLPWGKIGEVVIQGPNVMKGYSHNPTANEEAFSNGWFRTGDQGYLDEDGYLFLTGRLKEQINRGGEKIAPLEIDQVLLQHPYIQQAVTFGIPHPTLGEEVAAAVVLKPNTPLAEQELRRWLTPRLAQYKIPKKTFFLKDIPKGPTGKIQRRTLADQLLGLPSLSSEGIANKLEQHLIRLYQQYLGIDQVKTDDSFFMLGGDSILATQIANQLHGLTDSLPLDAVTIFENPTITELHLYLMENVEKEGLAAFCQDL